MLALLRRLFSKSPTPINTIQIDPRKFGANIDFLMAQHPHDAFFPVIKSNAYGHGIEPIVKLLNDANCTYICVDSYPEYAQARRISSHNFLVLSDTNTQNYRLYNWKKTAFVIGSHMALDYFIHKRKAVRIHLFINTGMNREGFDESELPLVIEKLSTARHIQIEGVMSHLSHGDDADFAHTEWQIATFKRLYTIITDAGHTPRYRHIGASAGTLTIDDTFFTAWRPGKAIYGYTPFQPDHPRAQYAAKWLEPIASVTSAILSTRTVKAWSSVWYDGTWTAGVDSTIALIPFWYFEGLPRALGNRRHAVRTSSDHKNERKLIPVIGNISMNYCCADITGIDANIWDRIEIFSADPSMENHITHAAKLVGTLDYEIMVHWDRGIRREIRK